ncbi:hypothetical protein, partial [Streptomyces goshikiensis]|uniref:hypothetical protein n=1 Tax=Streptomyces goshikiensis TaxID=1942 RepID=UPI00331D3CF9
DETTVHHSHTDAAHTPDQRKRSRQTRKDNSYSAGSDLMPLDLRERCVSGLGGTKADQASS